MPLTHNLHKKYSQREDTLFDRYKFLLLNLKSLISSSSVLSAYHFIFCLDFRVLKPPGGGSSDIFGAAPEETSPRRIKAHNQSQLSSALFGDTNGTDNATAAVSPRSNKPGNDSYKRLFGPPDAPSTPNARNHMRSNIPLSGESSISSQSSGTAMSPAKSTTSNNSTSGIANGYASNGSNSSNDMTGKSRWRTRKR